MSVSLVEARKQLRKLGAAHAEGHSLRAMYADLLVTMHGGKAETYFKWLLTQPNISEAGNSLLKDRAKAWDVLMGL